MTHAVSVTCAKRLEVSDGAHLYSSTSRTLSIAGSSRSAPSTMSKNTDPCPLFSGHEKENLAPKGSAISNGTSISKYLGALPIKYTTILSSSHTQHTKRQPSSDLTTSFEPRPAPARTTTESKGCFNSRDLEQPASGLSAESPSMTFGGWNDNNRAAKDVVSLSTSKKRFLRKRKRNHLEDQIKAVLVQSCTCSSQYIPRSQLEKLITPQSVACELGRVTNLPRRLLSGLAQPANVHVQAKVGNVGRIETRVFSMGNTGNASRDESYGIIFAILLMLKQSAKIWSFVEEGIFDADLPFEIGNDATEVRPRDAPQRTLKCFKKWDYSDRVEFLRKQWMFLVPSFDTKPGIYVRHQRLRDEHILPFTEWRSLDQGGFGEVFKAAIHPGHHAFGSDKFDGEPHVVAVKRLILKDKEAFAREADILRNLSLDRHADPHLITLLATYEQHGGFYIMFPFANSNLEQYWKDNPGPYKEDEVRAVWLFEQCVGLANALSTVHRYKTIPKDSRLFNAPHTIRNSEIGRKGVVGEPTPFLFGRHGDIKPSNILIFADERSTGGFGVLKITDFGITRFSTDDRRSVISGGRITNSPLYRSPECDIPNGNISTACDVWALGCVYLMFVTWFSRGDDSLGLFLKRLQDDSEWYEQDCFFSTYTDSINGCKKAKVKPCVTQLIDELRTDLCCTDEFAKFLNIIQEEMIIVQGDNSTSTLAASGLHHTRRSSSGNIGNGVGTLWYALHKEMDVLISP